MNRLYQTWLLPGCISFLLVLGCRETFLEKGPLGSLSGTTLASKSGVNGLLIGAYSLLDGIGVSGTGNAWHTGVSNFLLGSVAADDSHKGSEFGDESWMEQIENYSHNAASLPFNNKWRALYGGVQSANDVLRVLATLRPGELTAEETTQIRAEATFLRAVYHFEAAKIWRNIPFIDETILFEANNYKVANTTSAWPKIEADFQYAAANLAPTRPQAGRANSWAAKAFLAKVYLFQQKFSAAKPLLTDLIANGVTTAGQKYALVNFADNFDPTKKNGPESVFAVQMSVNDNSNGNNGNAGDVLNFASGSGPATCCGFNQPSFSLVNSFKTNVTTGLPLLDTWNDSDVKNDQGLSSNDPFTPYDGSLDPRLDWTVGRRGIPYLDWGIMAGASWIYAQANAGPYIPIKNAYSKANQAGFSDAYEGWATGQVSANNYVMIRFADIVLWAAEVEVEIGSVAQAETYVNQVRSRAANPAGWVKKYVDDRDPGKGFSNVPAANYKIGLYTGQFAREGKDYARKAVRFERKLELAMEGHRFFDLQRYDNGTGYMADVLNAYVRHETTIPGYNFLYMNGAKFTKGKNEIYPIPQNQIDLSTVDGVSVLKQNPGY
jgi:hypothetical protein